ncbi:hypothetical protein PNI02_19850 [Pseudoalteromonas nigrifaciens]|nr:hypothetical protein PNI02_19850 [Pseudoalteromonas nigrifaciens]
MVMEVDGSLSRTLFTALYYAYDRGLLSDVDLWLLVNTILVFKGGGWQVVLYFII